MTFAPGASGDTRDYRVDFSKIARQLPGYKPTWTLKAGIEELYNAYKAAKLDEATWNGPRYYRLKTINGLKQRGVIDDKLRLI